MIQNGDVVEIVRNPNAHPSRDWLNFVATSRARNRVRHWVADQQRAESIEIGRKLLDKEAGRFQLTVKKMLSDSNGDLKRIANEYGYGRTDDLLAAIGYGKTVPRNVIAKYLGPEKFEALDKQKESRLRSGVRAVKRLIAGDGAIVVRGVEDLMVNRARCCNPLHGEPIIGYITRGKGVAVHTAGCKNVKQLMINPERIVSVEWASKPEKTAYAVKLLAVTENRTGMIAGITGAISDMKTGIRDARASIGPDQKGRIEVTVEVFDVKHLDKVMSSVKNVAGVLDVERLQGAGGQAGDQKMVAVRRQQKPARAVNVLGHRLKRHAVEIENIGARQHAQRRQPFDSALLGAVVGNIKGARSRRRHILGIGQQTAFDGALRHQSRIGFGIGDFETIDAGPSRTAPVHRHQENAAAIGGAVKADAAGMKVLGRSRQLGQLAAGKQINAITGIGPTRTGHRNKGQIIGGRNIFHAGQTRRDFATAREPRRRGGKHAIDPDDAADQDRDRNDRHDDKPAPGAQAAACAWICGGAHVPASANCSEASRA